MASHWRPPAQPGGVTHLPQFICHLCHTDGLTSVTPHPSPDPAVILSLLTRPWSPGDVPTVPACPCPQEGDVVPLLSRPRSQPPAQPGRTCLASPRGWGCHGHLQGVAAGLGVTWRGHALFGLPEWDVWIWDRIQGVGWYWGDKGEGDVALMLRGLGWVCLASDAPSTAHTLGWVLTGSGGLGLCCRETPRGRCPPALCRHRTRRATGVTPRPPWGHPAPKPAGPRATGGHQSCHQVLLPCSLRSSDASVLLSRGCAVWRWLLAMAGHSLEGCSGPSFPPSFPLLPPLLLCLKSLFPSLSLSFSVSSSSPPILCPCPALCAGAGSLSFAPLTAMTSH